MRMQRKYTGIPYVGFLAAMGVLALFAGCRTESTVGTWADQAVCSRQVRQLVEAVEIEQEHKASEAISAKNLYGKALKPRNLKTSSYASFGGSDSDAKPVEPEKPKAVDWGKRTLLSFLQTAKEPLGHTMYVWGGGWNEEDTGAGREARTIGESPRWQEFFWQQDASYDYHNTRYQIHNGLDCSGYVGWILYNVFESTDGEAGYVEKATGMAKNFAGRGWGSYTPADQVSDWKPGDIMSMKGHVWISLGMCEDGSVLLLHASPPGVIMSGTLNSDGSTSRAVELAEHYMSTYYPDWYSRYPNCAKEANYLWNSGQMRWNRETLTDAEGISEMAAEQVLARLFP